MNTFEITKEVVVEQSLEQNARGMLAFLSENVAPVIMARNGKDLGNHIVWWKLK